MTGIIELMVVAIVIALLVLFKKQLGGLLIKARRKLDKNIQTSVKIEQTINELKKKQKLVKGTFNEINLNKAKIEIQAHKELKTAVSLGELKVEVKEDTMGTARTSMGGIPKLTKGEQYDVTGFSEAEPTEFFNIGLPSCWRINLFNIVSTSKNIVRYNSLRKLIGMYSAKAEKTEQLVNTIADSILSLNNDKEYVQTMESLVEIEQFDGDVDININNIMAEIQAIEKQLEMEEKLNGNFVEDTTPQSNNQ